MDGKLDTAGELYEFMMDQFHQSRGFFLEVVVVIILIIELVFLFRGKGYVQKLQRTVYSTNVRCLCD